MENQAQAMLSTPRRESWNRASSSARNHRCGQNMFGRYVPDCRWRDGRETWRCSIRQLTASCGNYRGKAELALPFFRFALVPIGD